MLDITYSFSELAGGYLNVEPGCGAIDTLFTYEAVLVLSRLLQERPCFART